MALGHKLQMRQTQSLVMTPQLLQSIKLLQLPHAELERFIEEEIERNPLLERVEVAEDGPPAEAGELRNGSSEPSPDAEDWLSPTLGGSSEISSGLDSSLENLFPDDPGRTDRIGPDLAAQWRSAQGSGLNGSEGYNLEEVTAATMTLRQHVGEQIALTFVEPADRIIAGELADALDEAGYMRGDLADIASRLEVGLERVADVLAQCREFEPVGLFARDLAECLALQLRSRDRLDPAMARMVDNLDLLAQRDFARLGRLCGVAEEDLLDMLAEIRALDPKPGLLFSAGTADTVVPDVMVSAAPDGSWHVELNSDALPRVLVDQAYFARVAGSTSNPTEKEFLSDCLQSANWLTRSLDQRARTILKVSSEIVKRQDEFLMHGVSRLKPLNLRMVAEAVGMHESTVSRVTSNKYMMTPRGMFELRYFFSVAIAASDEGEAHSSEAVRDRIRGLIEAETGDRVLSDDAIVAILRDGGIDIARRTVAKYREALHIPSSVRRRREKRAMAAARP